ncbi:hypothetical protein M8C21_032747 [Ambrosia artemisiifolia]|uniref:Uncharacterized protein n=1 Tax=Ambrosia artemisiifolia TaxID=4212 RepID=A0AAD5CLW1_AMBAR|nr:hypothetical protein M8C21_032747 [Ambrosia artemisiifolia]
MKTDPQNSDYVVESGAARNFEPWRAEDEVGEEEKKRRDAEEMGDAMKSLENRTLDSKREMDILSALDEMKSMKSRHAHVSVDSMLEALQRSAPVQQEEKLEEEDEALIKSIFQGSREFVRRIDDDELDDDDDDNITKKRKTSEDKPTDYLTKSTIGDKPNKKEESSGSSSGRIVLKSSTVKFSVVKKASEAKTQERNEEKCSQSNGLASLCQQYDSTDEED